MDLDWILNHLGEERDRYFGAVAPPLMQSAIFSFPTVAAMREQARDEFGHHFYTRGNNPTVEILRRKLAALEGAEDCLVFASGAAAIAAGVIAAVSAGDHVACVQKPYSWTRHLLAELLPRFGVTASFVDATEPAHIEAALTPRTRLIVLESPNSLTYELQDLAAVAALARARGVRTLCDNSYASPLNQSPLAFGIDLVAHSATKYLNGHGDVMAGALCGPQALLREAFRGPFMTLGAIPSPHDAWLLLRGLRTLPLRMQRCAATAARVVAFLEAHPKIERVWYPHSPSHPQHALALRQMRGASGLLSVAIRCDDVCGVERFCDALRRFLLSVSWGGYESLACPTAAFLPAATRTTPKPGHVPANLVRLSIGLEEADVLIADLAQALDKV
ncbi:MAG: aminotransferase class I/II-fold pyridoxal phosphate-dependent enzyme [Mizugakiibacter sp.]|uniref:trans-sulfuration enzyme family protein n=1 Tax=Mizugakiibacter sp. TaxID=1972610 RepID=UPI0031C2499A|nr:aminotransferase class I/II-fold pyridoxal phosphate-dependent enzyme [Xanthomonadaceae bacterium]